MKSCFLLILILLCPLFIQSYLLFDPFRPSFCIFHLTTLSSVFISPSPLSAFTCYLSMWLPLFFILVPYELSNLLVTLLFIVKNPNIFLFLYLPSFILYLFLYLFVHLLYLFCHLYFSSSILLLLHSFHLFFFHLTLTALFLPFIRSSHTYYPVFLPFLCPFYTHSPVLYLFFFHPTVTPFCCLPFLRPSCHPVPRHARSACPHTREKECT